MEAVKSANELRDMQRANQARSDFQQFTPDLTTDFTGLKLGAQPDTRPMIRKNADGSYGTDTGLEEFNRTGKITGNKVGLVDPTKAPVASAGAMDTAYNQARNTGKYGGKDIVGQTGPDGKSITFLDAIFGVRPVPSLNPVDPNALPYGIKDTDTYKEQGLPNMQDGPNQIRLQSGIDKGRLDAASARLDLTDDERKQLDAASNMPIDSEEKRQARAVRQRTIQDAIERRRNLARLKEIKNMQDGPIKRIALKEFKESLGGDITGILEEIQAVKAGDTSPEKIVKTFQNVPTTGANDVVRQAVQKRNEIARLANIAKSEGNRAKFEEYKAQLSALDKGIIVAQGMQGLDDLSVGDTRRLSAVMTNATGRNIQIIPQDNGMFNVIGYGDKPQIMSDAEMKIAFKPIIDKEYAKRIEEIQVQQYNDKYKAGLEINKEIMKQQGELAIEIAKQKEIRTTELAKEGYKITKDVAGAGVDGKIGTLIEKDGNLYRLREDLQSDPEGNDKLYLNLEPIGDSATQLGLEGFKQRAGL